MNKHSIALCEERGDQLVICVIHIDKPISVEHYCTEAEKLDLKGTLEYVVAVVEVLGEEYVDPVLPVPRIDEVKAIVLDRDKIDLEKIKYKNTKPP